MRASWAVVGEEELAYQERSRLRCQRPTAVGELVVWDLGKVGGFGEGVDGVGDMGVRSWRERCTESGIVGLGKGRRGGRGTDVRAMSECPR